MARVTFVEHIYYQNPGQQPVSLGNDHPYEIETENNEDEPYGQRYTLGTTPVDIERGWLREKEGMMLIRNLSAEGYVRVGVSNIPPKSTAKMWPNWEVFISEISADRPNVKAYVTILPK